MTDYSKVFALIDACIRGNRLVEARRRLLRVVGRRLPRREALPAAILARRLALSSKAAQILNPIIRPVGAKQIAGTAKEQAEYALNLMRIGAHEEAQAILATLDPTKLPEVWLYRGYAHVFEWSYAESIGLFRKYLESAPIEPYERLVVEANLAAALVSERRHAEAEELLGQLIEKTRAQGHTRLFGAALELRAESAIHQRRWDTAEKILDQAREKSTEDERALLFQGKWRAIAALLRRPGNSDALVHLAKVRKEATRLRHWETVRACDRAQAIGNRDARLANLVYYGTPFASFRTSLKRDWPQGAFLEESFDWYPGGAKRGPVIDLSTGLVLGKRSELKPGQVLHRLLAALSSDFYRPQRIPALYAALFPGQWFNPESSGPRVHRAIQRLRGELRKCALGLTVSVSQTEARIEPRGNACGIRVSHAASLPDRNVALETRLRSQIAGNQFTLNDARKKLELSPSGFHRWARWAIETNRLEKIGAGARTRYRLRD